MHAAELPVMPYGQFGLLAVQFLPSSATWDEPHQPVECRHDQRACPLLARWRVSALPHGRANLLAAIVIHWNPSILAKRSSSGNPPG